MNGFSFSKKEFKSELDRVGSYFSYKVLAQAIQFAFAPLFGVLVISRLFPEINYGFGFLLASGFSGGHGAPPPRWALKWRSWASPTPPTSA